MFEYFVLTGASGFIGKGLVKELLSNGYHVIAIVREQNGKSIVEASLSEDEKKNIDYIFSDIEHIQKSDFPNLKYKMWIHTSWGGINRESINDDIIQERNYRLEIKCLKIAKELGCCVFCDTGSRAEYGNSNNLLIEEPVNISLNKYGYYKQEAYKSAYEYCSNNDMKYIHFRLFSVIGVGDHPWSVVMSSCKNFTLNLPMSFGSCEQIWNFMDVRDVAICIRKVYEAVFKDVDIGNGIINIASYTNKKLKEFILEIYDICNSKSIISFSKNKGFDSYPSNEKLINIIGEYKEIKFEETIKEILRRV